MAGNLPSTALSEARVRRAAPIGVVVVRGGLALAAIPLSVIGVWAVAGS